MRTGDPKDQNRQRQLDHARRLIKFTERKAKELGVTIDEYLAGVANGKYPPYRQEDIEAEPLD